MVETIYILRHGDRLGWNTDDWENVTGIPRDDPLSPKGVQQAEEVARYFMSIPTDERPTAIFSSPLYRCLQTVTPTSIALGVPVYVEHGLGEWWQPLPDGDLHDRPDTGEKLRKYFPDISVSWSSALVPSQKGEELHELHQRMSDCASIIIQRVGKVAGTRDGRKEDDRVVENLMNILSGAKCVVEDLTNDKHSRILFVGHVAPLIALIRMLIGESELPLRLGCASISTLRKETDTTIHRDVKVDNGREKPSSIGTYHPLKINSSDHLADGEWIPWGFMDM